MLTHAGRRRPGLLTLAPDSASGQDLPPGRLASSVMRCWGGGGQTQAGTGYLRSLATFRPETVMSLKMGT